MNKLYWIVSVVIGLVLSSIFLSGAGIEANRFFSAPERISKLIVSVFFSIAVIIVVHKFICAILQKPPSMDGG
jgi:formate/nitrite transporter FocA (FNT family)